MKRRVLETWGRLPIPKKLRRRMVLLAVRKFPVAVTAAILDDSGRILLFKHTYRGRYPWGMPTGWLEPGEQPDAAIAREIREETGMDVAGVQVLRVDSAADVDHIEIVFRARLSGGSFRPSAEVSEMAWYTLDELPEMMVAQSTLIQQIYRIST
jgi:ADP-ribose pyrophosphatase YjhB (NUDIX family)